MTSASPELLNGKNLTDKMMSDAKKANWTSQDLRELGYKLAVRELHGENTPAYYKEKRRHQALLFKLYELEKRAP